MYRLYSCALIQSCSDTSCCSVSRQMDASVACWAAISERTMADGVSSRVRVVSGMSPRFAVFHSKLKDSGTVQLLSFSCVI